jgi:ribosomal protein L22
MAEDKDTKKRDSGAKSSGSKSPAKKPAAKKPAGKKPASKKAAAKPKTETKPKTEAKTKTQAKPKTEAKPKAAAKPKATAKPRDAAKPKEAPKPPVVNARARYVRVAPRKARLIADQVRGMHVDDAKTLLRFSTRGAARDIAKLLDSATANAEANHDLVADELRVADITVDEGPTLRRYRPRALGRATRINKRTSHIHVALTPED